MRKYSVQKAGIACPHGPQTTSKYTLRSSSKEGTMRGNDWARSKDWAVQNPRVHFMSFRKSTKWAQDGQKLIWTSYCTFWRRPACYSEALDLTLFTGSGHFRIVFLPPHRMLEEAFNEMGKIHEKETQKEAPERVWLRIDWHPSLGSATTSELVYELFCYWTGVFRYLSV